MSEIDYNKVRAIGEMFPCIQGEGRYAGIPHLLIRLMGCNLNCSFTNSICDTAYASWAPEKGKHTLGDLLRLIDDNPQIRHAFVTGGEPTIQPALLTDVLFILKAKGFFTAIETNGSNYVDDLHGLLDFVTISPKMANSVPVPGMRAKSEWVDREMTQADVDKQNANRARYDQTVQWIKRFHHQVKFVISNEQDMIEAQNIIDILGVQSENVYLMPEGDLNDKIQARRQMVIELAVKHGYRYTDRLHIIAYGAQRGV